MTGLTNEEHYGISDERAMEIKNAICPSEHKNAGETADALFEVCKDENEMKYAIAHLSACFMKMSYKAYEAELALGII